MKAIDFSNWGTFSKVLTKLGIESVGTEFNADYIPVFIPEPWKKIKPITKVINIEQVGTDDNGALTVDGQYVLLYIRDHHYNPNIMFNDSRINIDGYRYHIAECTTIESMRQKNQYEKYVVSNEITGMFPIHFISSEGETIIEDREIPVCKNCLRKLNWHGFISYPKTPKQFDEFDLKEYFEEQNGNNTGNFSALPHRNSNSKILNTYTKDWPEISKLYRKSKHYICEWCGKDESSHPENLHVHHRNAIKNDNRTSNLQVLCVDCHRKLHPHMGKRNKF